MDDVTLADLGHRNQLEFLRETARWSGRDGAVAEDDGVLLVATGSPFPVLCNAAARLHPDVDAPALLATADAWFGARGRGWSLVTHDHDGADLDLRAAAAAAGMLAVLQPPEMVCREPVTAPSTSAGVAVEWVDDIHDVADFVAVNAAAYATIGMPEGVIEASITAPDALLAPHLHAVVARLDGRPVAAALVLLSHGIAGVYWVGTVDDARGRGLGAAVTAAVTNRAFDCGAAAVTLQASPMGEPIYRSLGYETLYGYETWVRFDPPNAT